MATLSTTSSSWSNGSCSPYDTAIYSIIVAVTVTSSILSLLANILVLFFIVLFKRWRYFNQRLVLYLSMATVCADVSSTLGLVQYDNQTGSTYNYFCMFSGFFFQITSWMVLNAYICITAALLLKLFFLVNLEKYDVAILLFVFASPITFNWIPFIKLAYGKAGAWCWIRSTEETNCDVFLFGQVLQLILWYVPLYAILGILIILYVVVVVKFFLHRRKRIKQDPLADNERRQALRYSISLLAYPVIYFAINIFPLINRAQELNNPTSPSPALWFLSGIFYPQQGMGIAVAFFLGSDVRKRMTVTNFRAAYAEWFRKPKIKEYPI